MKVHILYFPSMLYKLEELVDFLHSKECDVNLLMPYQKTQIEDGDPILILDSGGINANTAPFYPYFAKPPKVAPQDQWLEFFRCNMLEYYTDKQKAKIIAIGYSALMVFGQLGGKIEMGDNDLMPTVRGVPNLDYKIQGDSYELQKGNKFLGLSKLKLDGNFYAKIVSFCTKHTNLESNEGSVTVVV